MRVWLDWVKRLRDFHTHTHTLQQHNKELTLGQSTVLYKEVVVYKECMGFLQVCWMWEQEIIQSKPLHDCRQDSTLFKVLLKLCLFLRHAPSFSICLTPIFTLLLLRSLVSDLSLLLSWSESVTPHWAAIVFSWLQLFFFINTTTLAAECLVYVFLSWWHFAITLFN